MGQHKFKKSFVYVPLAERLAAKAADRTAAAAPQPAGQTGSGAHRAGPEGQAPLCAVKEMDPRFNARKHNYTGLHVATNPEEESEYKEIFDGFAGDYGTLSATHLNHIEEASKAKLQVRRIERDLPKAIAENGYDSKKVALMHRYLKEHRAQLRHSLNALMSAFRFDHKRNVVDTERALSNRIKAVTTGIKSTETEFARTNPGIINELFQSAGFHAAASPPKK